MLRTGLRVSDVLAIRTEQVQSCRLTVSESKTGKTRTVRLPQSVIDRMRSQAGRVYVWEHAKSEDKHRTRQAVWWDIKRAAKAMRIPLQISPHSARKSYACAMYRRTGDIFKVQSLLNHDRLETTVLYLLDEFARRQPQENGGSRKPSGG
jgi:integrase